MGGAGPHIPGVADEALVKEGGRMSAGRALGKDDGQRHEVQVVMG